VIVPFSVHVPRRTQPGQYIGGLTAFVPAHRTQISHRIGLTVQTRVFDAILVTVPGRLHAAMRIAGVSARYRSNQMYALIHIRNTGNVLLKAHGFVWLFAPGSTRAWIHRPVSVDTTVPGTTVHYPLLWAHRVRSGAYRYAVTLSWTRGDYRAASAHDLMRWSAGHTSTTGYVRVR
jgi:hypothetical protein